MNQSTNHPKHPTDQSINQSINVSKQPSNQSINIKHSLRLGAIYASWDILVEGTPVVHAALRLIKVSHLINEPRPR